MIQWLNLSLLEYALLSSNLFKVCKFCGRDLHTFPPSFWRRKSGFFLLFCWWKTVCHNFHMIWFDFHLTVISKHTEVNSILVIQANYGRFVHLNQMPLFWPQDVIDENHHFWEHIWWRQMNCSNTYCSHRSQRQILKRSSSGMKIPDWSILKKYLTEVFLNYACTALTTLSPGSPVHPDTLDHCDDHSM